MKTLYKIPFLLITFSLYVNAQWADQESGVVADLIDVSFADPLNGCIIGEEATILTTNDGGEHWIKRQSPVEEAVFTKVQIIDESNGFIVGNDGLFLKTVNGGITWTPLFTAFDYHISDLSFIDPQQGWISCWYTDLSSPARRDGAIMHTSDGGTHWETQLEIFGNIHDGTQFMSIEFFDKNIGWAIGGSYVTKNSYTYIYNTTNGGINWEELATVYTKPLRELYCIDKNTLWVSKSYHLVSQDGGANWAQHSDQNSNVMLVASPIDKKHGWINGYVLDSRNSKILFTGDGGASWIEDLALGSKFANSMTNIDGDYLWIVEDNGYIKYRQGTPTDIKNENLLASEFELSQNYPNPFNPITTIKYTIAREERRETFTPQNAGRNVKLIVYDVLGEEVVTLVDREQGTGNYEVEWNAENQASGVYIYQLTVGDPSSGLFADKAGSGQSFVETKKMILLR